MDDLEFTDEDREDMDRIFGAAKRAGRLPSEEEVSELMLLKLVRDAVAAGKFSIAALRKQFGGIDKERTIRKAAKALTFYHLQIRVIEDADGVGMTVPDGLRETFAALHDNSDDLTKRF
jgi:hypothetical protein